MTRRRKHHRLGLIHMTHHRSAVYRSASCPGNPATCEFRTFPDAPGRPKGPISHPANAKPRWRMFRAAPTSRSVIRPQPPQASSRTPRATSPSALSALRVSCRAHPAPAHAPYTGGTKPQHISRRWLGRHMVPKFAQHTTVRNSTAKVGDLQTNQALERTADGFLALEILMVPTCA